MKIGLGDVVKLKSSDVSMSVMTAGDGDVVCGWHDKVGQFHLHAFPQLLLVQTLETVAAHEKAAADVAKAEAKAKADAKAAAAPADKPVGFGGLGGPGPMK